MRCFYKIRSPFKLRIIIFLIILTFSSSLIMPPLGYGQPVGVTADGRLGLPKPGMMVLASPVYQE